MSRPASGEQGLVCRQNPRPAPFVSRAVDVASSIRRGDTSATEVVQTCLDRIAALDGRLRSFITVGGERAIEEAMAADAALKAGHARGVLHGVPVAIKDLSRTSGLRTTFGSVAYRDHVPTVDDPCVARLRQAGAIIVGKTNTPEFGCGPICTNAICGPTANPHDIRLSSGVSSGGSAAAVAAGLVPIAHGTDLGGSVRMPASFCGVVGLRPTPGRIPDHAFTFEWNSLNVHGVLGRCVEDVELSFSALTGADAPGPNTLGDALPGGSAGRWWAADHRPRVAFSPDLGVCTLAPEVLEGLNAAVAGIERRMGPLGRAHPDCGGARRTSDVFRAAHFARNYGRHCDSYGDAVSGTLRRYVEQGRRLTAVQYCEAQAERGTIHQRFAEFFEECDLLMTASAAMLPYANDAGPALDTDSEGENEYFSITSVISLAGFPAMSIPCGWSNDDLPIGLQLIGRPFEERNLMSFANFLQTELEFCHRWPDARADSVERQ